MSNEVLEAIDEDLDVLLEAERTAKPPAVALDRVWARVVSAPLAAGPPRPRPDRWLATHAAPVAIGAFVLGGAVGAGLYATLHAPPPERIVRIYVPTPSAAALPAPSAEASAPVVEQSLVAPSASAPPATPRASAPAPADSSSLSAERLALDQARAALTAGEPNRALVLLSEYARRFARPQLGEEREAIAIQALASAGRYDEARARAARFRATAPNSLFLPAVDATLASIP